MAKNISSNNPTMEALLSSLVKPIQFVRGQEVEGEVVSITDKEIILDFKSKSEGVIPKRDISHMQNPNLKIGDKIKAFVVSLEDVSGQILLSFTQPSQTLKSSSSSSYGRQRSPSLDRFIQSQNQKSRLNGQVIEVNRGGLIVEVFGVRGFLPNSQVGFELIKKASEGSNSTNQQEVMSQLVGKNLTITVIEVDKDGDRVIFSQKGQTSKEVLEKLDSYKLDQKVKGKVVTLLPFGAVLDLDGVGGIVFISDISWDKVEDISKFLTIGDEVEAQVLGKDTDLGRLTLSIKQLKQDPFSKLSEKYSPDEVVKGVVEEVGQSGVIIKLEDPSGELGTGGLEGFIPASKLDPKTIYEKGKSVTLLVDSVDKQRRKINLAPLITTTEGLIYK